MRTIAVLDLFSGIGGFSLGLERTGGFRTVAFCEIDPYCRRVLAKHWPEVPCYDDVRTLSAARLAADGISVDAICGGFPCQDVSVAGNGAGLAGERSGLWREYERLIAEIRPRWVAIENVPALRSRGLDEVLGALSALGYDAEWDCVPAAAVGAPHLRDRIWIVAYPNEGQRDGSVEALRAGGHAADAGSEALADADSLTGHERRPSDATQGARGGYADRSGVGAHVAHTYRPRLEIQLDRHAGELAASLGASPWAAEPDVGRVAYGVPSRVDRLRALGNAVVPQIPEALGRAILHAESLEARHAA